MGWTQDEIEKAVVLAQNSVHDILSEIPKSEKPIKEMLERDDVPTVAETLMPTEKRWWARTRPPCLFQRKRTPLCDFQMLDLKEEQLFIHEMGAGGGVGRDIATMPIPTEKNAAVRQLSMLGWTNEMIGNSVNLDESRIRQRFDGEIPDLVKLLESRLKVKSPADFRSDHETPMPEVLAWTIKQHEGEIPNLALPDRAWAYHTLPNLETPCLVRLQRECRGAFTRIITWLPMRTQSPAATMHPQRRKTPTSPSTGTACWQTRSAVAS